MDYLKSAPAVAPLPEGQLASAYRKYRVQVFLSVYFGYAFFYLIRKNLSIALPAMMDSLQLSKTQMGVILSLFGATYALAKLVNGPLCDRSNPRYFMAFALFGAAVVSIFFGLSSSIWFFGIFWILNGYFQSMGSPIGPKTMANWFSSKERGKYYSIWNTCHNIGSFAIVLAGGFIVERMGWRFGFFLPAALCLAGALLVAWKMQDRPESVGLPPIQVYHGEVEKNTVMDTNESAKELFQKYVLRNPRIWLLAFSCMLIYMVRYGLGDWGVTYLTEVKKISISSGGIKSSFLELMAIPGTILAGFIADKFFPKKNLVVALIYIVGVIASVLFIYYLPGNAGIWDGVAFGMAGFFIYGAQMVCTGLGPLALVPRRAVASAVGLTGAMSYIGTFLTSIISGWISDQWGWTSTFIFWIACAFIAVLILIPLVVSRNTQESY
ncbi:MAG: MFS transporter [Prolixibacteraceae bacterium]|jgi:sugar phosphate permease|nr:MFS transporter [Prolixibacteraceae bacterium]